MNKLSAAHIFRSHSHKDLEKVREIRNELERRGHNPLIFFLKCLENDEAELPDLLYREIAARNWFILCDRPNAQSSKWVQQEVSMIKSLEDKIYARIDLSMDFESQLKKINIISKRVTVFISYAWSNYDTEFALRVSKYLADADFSTWTIHETELGAYLIETKINEALEDALQKGFVLLLLSEVSLKSKSCLFEIKMSLKYARNHHMNNVIPIIIDHIDLSALPHDLRNVQIIDMTTGSFEEQMNVLISSLKNREIA